MSDRPCNLANFRDLQRRNPGRKVETRIEEHGWHVVYIDDERAGVSYLALPTDATCAAYGGQCNC